MSSIYNFQESLTSHTLLFFKKNMCLNFNLIVTEYAFNFLFLFKILFHLENSK